MTASGRIAAATGTPTLRVYWKKNNNTLYNDTSVTVR